MIFKRLLCTIYNTIYNIQYMTCRWLYESLSQYILAMQYKFVTIWECDDMTVWHSDQCLWDRCEVSAKIVSLYNQWYWYTLLLAANTTQHSDRWMLWWNIEEYYVDVDIYWTILYTCHCVHWKRGNWVKYSFGTYISMLFLLRPSEWVDIHIRIVDTVHQYNISINLC